MSKNILFKMPPEAVENFINTLDDLGLEIITSYVTKEMDTNFSPWSNGRPRKLTIVNLICRQIKTNEKETD